MSSQDAAVKLAQERAEIVAKYDRGRDGAQIEPWEDADYRLYKVTDRFGFLHNFECIHLEKILKHILISFQQKHLEIERTTKWLKMLKSWEKYKNSEKVNSTGEFIKGSHCSSEGKFGLCYLMSLK
uniref:USP6 N-terminal like n=1 Tax=Anas platyrhynchos platyrhynchos TaxID=8840 RepID=A0A493TKF8_ANAPP